MSIANKSHIDCPCWKTGEFKQVPCYAHDGKDGYPAGAFWRQSTIDAIHLLYEVWEKHQGMSSRAGFLISHAMQYLGKPDRYARPKRGPSAVKTGKSQVRKQREKLIANLWDVL